MIVLVCSIAFGNFSYFHAIAVALQYRASLCKFYGFFYRICLYNNVAANSFFYFTKRPVGHYIVVPDHFTFIKWQAVALYEFVLGSYATNPVHGLFHPYLDLFGGGHFSAILV